MDKTLNQLKKELFEIAREHRQINEFFFGDFIDSISRDAVQYPLMVATIQPGSMGDQFVSMNFQLIICDKYNESNYSQIDEIHSDCLQICNDIRITLNQYRFEDFLDVEGDISTDPFINRGHDLTAGWTMNVNVKVYDNDDFCSIPFDNYDFGND